MRLQRNLSFFFFALLLSLFSSEYDETNILGTKEMIYPDVKFTASIFRLIKGLDIKINKIINHLFMKLHISKCHILRRIYTSN